MSNLVPFGGLHRANTCPELALKKNSLAVKPGFVGSQAPKQTARGHLCGWFGLMAPGAPTSAPSGLFQGLLRGVLHARPKVRSSGYGPLLTSLNAKRAPQAVTSPLLA